MRGRWVSDAQQSFEFVDENDGHDPNANDKAVTENVASGFPGTPQWMDFSACSTVLDSDELLGSFFQCEQESSISPHHHLESAFSGYDGAPTSYSLNLTDWMPTKTTNEHKLPLLAPKPAAPYPVFSDPGETMSSISGLRPLAPKPFPSLSAQKTLTPISKSTSAKISKRKLTSRTIQVSLKERTVGQSLQAATSFDRAVLDGLCSINLTIGYNMSLPISRMDMYIKALRQVSRTQILQDRVRDGTKRAISAEGVLWAVREAWPSIEGYYNMTATFRGFLAVELWRNFPCERTYRQLPPVYRPTRAQMIVPHPPNIDWLPWPDVRDLAIMCQDLIDMDGVFRMAIQNVVVHRRRGHSAGATGCTSSSELEDPTCFRVWDLVCSEKANGTEPSADSRLKKKAILRSPRVKAVLRDYDLEYDQFETQKLDEGFFKAFPSLYADSAASSWRTQALDGVPLVDVGVPVSLSRPAMSRLQARINALVSSTA